MPDSTPPSPKVVTLPAGDYDWCRCARQSSEPLCTDGSCTNRQRFSLKGKSPETLWLCRCDATKTPPFCDGSHNHLGKTPKRGWSLLAGRAQ
jgi:CDGSH-type Zn-finger protein